MFVQSFGDTANAAPEDVVTAMEFDRTGNYLGVGDRGGRIILFKRNLLLSKKANEKKASKSNNREWIPYFQFQSHEAEFDYLKSLDIDEKICKLKFFKEHCGSASQLLLTTNEKTLKLFKIGHRRENYLTEPDDSSQDTGGSSSWQGGFGRQGSGKNSSKPVSSKDLKLPKLGGADAGPKTQVYASCKRIFSNAHVYNVNSISLHSDGETFLSADDLRINTWTVDNNSRCFNIIDIKPDSMEELTEVITCAEYHPTDSALCVYATSGGSIKVVDTRTQAIFEKNLAHSIANGGCRVFNSTPAVDAAAVLGPNNTVSSTFNRIAGAGPAAATKDVAGVDTTNTSFFSEMVSSISDVQFSHDARFLLSRDFLTVKIWDLAATQYKKDSPQPVTVIPIHDHIKPHLTALYEADAIFDKFAMDVSSDGSKIITGSYSNQFSIFHSADGRQLHNCDVGTSSAASRKNHDSGRRSVAANNKDIDMQKKVLNVAWCPDGDMVAVAGNAGLYIYRV